MRYVQRALIAFGVLTLLPARAEGQRLVTQDVVAIEHHGASHKVPEPLERFARSTHAVATDAGATAAPTPIPSARGCALIVYWLREAPARTRERRGTNAERIILRKP